MKKPKPVHMNKKKNNVITGKIDLNKIPKGLNIIKANAGAHGLRKKPRKKSFNDEIEN